VLSLVLSNNYWRIRFMKKLVNAVAVAALVLSASAASAQDAKDAGVFADAAGTQSTFTAAAFVPFNLYLVAFGLDGNVLGYEFRTLGLEGLTILLSTPSVGPNGGINLGDSPGEFIVGTGACLTADPAGAFVMATLNVGSFADPTGANLIDKAVCIAGSTPSSFEQFGSPPGWLRCDGTLDVFGVAQNGSGVYPNGCLILNATNPGSVVATEATSFGEMKARF
jgi:hypothetical protein